MRAAFEVVAEGLAFPEGPVAMPDGSVILVEMRGQRVSRCWGAGRREVVAETGGGPNGAAIGPDGGLYICNNGGGWGGEYDGGRIERIDLATGRVERVCDRTGEHPLSAPNDLVFDAQGGLWFTDFGRNHARSVAKSGVYHLKPGDGSAHEAVYGGLGYNGVGLSPDGRALYVATTYSGRLHRFEVEGPGRVAPSPPKADGPGTVIGCSVGIAGFDSLAVLASGAVCVGTLSPGGVTTITPTGETSVLPLDDAYVTNIAFGGADMHDAYLTLSESGRLVKMRWPEPGLKLNF